MSPVTSGLGVCHQFLEVVLFLPLQVTPKFEEAGQQLFLLRVRTLSLGHILPKLVCLGVLEGTPGIGKPLPQCLSLVLGEAIQELLDVLVASLFQDSILSSKDNS